jgi:hypothetical protein
VRKALLSSLTAAAFVAGAPAAGAWAPASSAPIHPGVQTYTKGGQCTSNFVFADGPHVYLGQAAHCAGKGEATDTNGCRTASFPLGTVVHVQGARKRAHLVYSSWRTMHDEGREHGAACRFNDFALVEIANQDERRVNPTVPGFGGPTGLGGLGADGADVYSYGNSSLRGGVSTLSPKQGKVVDQSGRGWSYTVYTATPGIPGDSGSGFLNRSGEAAGVLSTLDVLPDPGGNGVGSLPKELAYMHRHSPFGGVDPVPGTRPFDPDLPGAIAGG